MLPNCKSTFKSLMKCFIFNLSRFIPVFRFHLSKTVDGMFLLAQNWDDKSDWWTVIMSYDFFSKCEWIRSFFYITKESVMESFIFCAKASLCKYIKKKLDVSGIIVTTTFVWWCMVLFIWYSFCWPNRSCVCSCSLEEEEELAVFEQNIKCLRDI